jgi:tetratricopeptide (TPR) repeat protein
MDQRLRRFQLPAFGLMAVLAAVLSLAAALVALHAHSDNDSTGIDPKLAAQQASLREQRIAFFETRASADSLDFTSLNVLAGEYLQRGRETGDVADYQRAETAASRSVAIVPKDNYTGLYYLASVRLVEHDYKSVKDISDQLIALKPEEVSGYGTLGDAFVGLGRYDEARAAFETMVQKQGTLPALSRLANLALITGDVNNSIDYWKQAYARAAGLPVENAAWVHTQLASVYLARGDIKDSDSEYQQSLKIYPNYVHALAGMGAVRAEQGRWSESSDYYTQAVNRLPQPQYVAALGDVYALSGDQANAQEQYALVEAIDKLYQANGINTDLLLSLFYSEHNRNPERALSMAQASYDGAPNVYAADSLGFALYRNGRFDEAEARAQEAIRYATSEAGFFYHAALVEKALGHTDAAHDLMQKAVTLNPHHPLLQTPAAKQAIAELQVKS